MDSATDVEEVKVAAQTRWPRSQRWPVRAARRARISARSTDRLTARPTARPPDQRLGLACLDTLVCQRQVPVWDWPLCLGLAPSRFT